MRRVSYTGITAAAGAAYSFTGPVNNKLLSVTAGTVTLTRDLSGGYPGISLNVGGNATVVFAADQNFANVSLSGNGTVSVGEPPPPAAGGDTADSGFPTATQPTPTATATQAPVPAPAVRPVGLTAAPPVMFGTARTTHQSPPTRSSSWSWRLTGYAREAFVTFVDLSKLNPGPIHTAHLRLFGRTTARLPAGCG